MATLLFGMPYSEGSTSRLTKRACSVFSSVWKAWRRPSSCTTRYRDSGSSPILTMRSSMAIKIVRPEHQKGDFVKGRAMVSYFTGDYDLLPKTETALGTIHASRTLRMDFFGTGMTDTPYIRIDFHDATTLEGAWEKMREVRQFFAWMMGYAPAWNSVRVFTCKTGEDGYGVEEEGQPDDDLEVFGPNESRAVAEYMRAGSLIDGSRNPDHFMEVMVKWLARNGEKRRRSANTRFFGSLEGTNVKVMEDGIVSAANTFDLLPDGDKPETSSLPPDILAVLVEAGEKIKKTVVSPERTDVLNKLGRIRANNTLRDIVEHRAEVVLGWYGEDRLEGFGEVIRQAVLCRNHYTHGPSGGKATRTDFADFGLVVFLTKTLQFIYGASELLLCGWDTTTSLRDELHPIGGYIRWYESNRSELAWK